MKFILVCLMSVVMYGIANAAPTPPGVQTPIFGNDGYIRLEYPYHATKSIVPKYCPIGSKHNNLVCGKEFSGFGSDKLVGPELPRKTAQELLDDAYGVGKLQVIGVAPYVYSDTTDIIFYKVLK